MRTIINIISKYSYILILSYLVGQTWFYLKTIILPIDDINDYGFWHQLPTYSHYFFKFVIAILLFIDIKKYNLNYFFIPLVGLFYPLLGIVSLLIMYIYREIDEKKLELEDR